MNLDEIKLDSADLENAVKLGIINEVQRGQILGLAVRREKEAEIDAADENEPPQIISIETKSKLNFVAVMYYLGGVVILCGLFWFLFTSWRRFGPGEIFAISFCYMVIFGMLGYYLQFRGGFKLAGGLMFTLMVCFMPIVSMAFLNMTGFDTRMRSNTILLDRLKLATLASNTVLAGIIVLYFVRFSFVVVPTAISFVYFSALVPWIISAKRLDDEPIFLMMLLAGIALAVLGLFIDKKKLLADKWYYLWLYIIGLGSLWIGSTFLALDNNDFFITLLYLIGCLAVVFFSIYVKRLPFLIFGALGIASYIIYITLRFFSDSAMFPIAIIAIGIFLIVATVLGQKFWRSKVIGRSNT